MEAEIAHVNVLIEKRRSTSPWAEFSWHVIEVVAGAPPQSHWTEIRKDDHASTYLTGTEDIAAHKSDTSGYRDNLNSGAPKLWVVLRPTDEDPGCELALITADPGEGEAMTQNGDLFVETVAMPEAVRLWLTDFTQKHHIERPFTKRRRD